MYTCVYACTCSMKTRPSTDSPVFSLSRCRLLSWSEGGGGGGGKGGCRGEGRRICCGSPRLVGRGRAHCRINGELADSALWQDGLDVTATLLLGLRLGLGLALQQDGLDVCSSQKIMPRAPDLPLTILPSSYHLHLTSEKIMPREPDLPELALFANFITSGSSATPSTSNMNSSGIGGAASSCSSRVRDER